MAHLELHRVGRAVDDLRNAGGLQAVVAEGQHAQIRHVEHAVRKRFELVVVQMKDLPPSITTPQISRAHNQASELHLPAA